MAGKTKYGGYKRSITGWNLSVYYAGNAAAYAPQCLGCSLLLVIQWGTIAIPVGKGRGNGELSYYASPLLIDFLI